MLTETGLANPVPETVTTPRTPPTRKFRYAMSLEPGTPAGLQSAAVPQLPVPVFQFRSVAHDTVADENREKPITVRKIDEMLMRMSASLAWRLIPPNTNSGRSAEFCARIWLNRDSCVRSVRETQG